MKFLHFFLVFLRVNFALRDPDPDHCSTVFEKTAFLVFFRSEEQYREEFLRGCSPHGRILDKVDNDI